MGKTDKFNVGLETQFFDRRLTVDFDYYYEKTIDLINDVTLSNTSGFQLTRTIWEKWKIKV